MTNRGKLHQEVGRRLQETLVLSRFDQKHGAFLDSVGHMSMPKGVLAINFDAEDQEKIVEYFGRDGWTPDSGDVMKEVDGVHVWINNAGVEPVPFTFQGPDEVGHANNGSARRGPGILSATIP